jgi:hypothetical protein
VAATRSLLISPSLGVPYIGVGEAVEFNSGAKGTVLGVVASVKAGARTVSVRAADGGMWRVPRAAIRHVTLTEEVRAAIQESKQAERREAAQRRSAVGAFAIGDKVTFGRTPATHEPGMVLRVNSRTVTVRDARGKQWRVGPQFVRAMKGTP